LEDLLEEVGEGGSKNEAEHAENTPDHQTDQQIGDKKVPPDGESAGEEIGR
jgi:hypothetical protein